MSWRVPTNALLAVAFFIFGCALRTATLEQEALWSDEYYTLLTAGEPTIGAVLSHVQDADPHPPLYFVIMHAWIAVAGSSDFTLRLPSALASCAALPLVWWIALMLFPRRLFIANVALLLMAVSPMQIWYAQEARAYALQVFFEVGTFAFLVRGNGEWGIRNGRNKFDFILFLSGSAVFALLSVYTHYHSAFFIFAYLILICVWAVRDRERRAALIAAAVVLVLASVPAGIAAGKNFFSGKGIDWMPQNFTMRGIVDVWQAQVVGPLYFPVPGAFFWSAMAAAIVLAGLGCMALWELRKDEAGKARALVVGAGLVCCLVMPVVISLTWKHIIFYGQRYLTIATPFLVLLFAGALVSRRKIVIGISVISMCVMIVAQGFYLFDYYKYRQKHVWDSAAAFVQKQNMERLPVLVWPGRLAGLFERYMDKSGEVRGINDLRECPLNGQGFVLVTLTDSRGWFRAQGMERPMTSALFETHRKGQDLWVLMVKQQE